MSGLFRTPKSFLQTSAWQHAKLNALRYNTSQAGSVVPWMDGTTRVAVNLIDFGNYRGPNGGGKKGKGVGPLPVGGTNNSGGFKGGGGGKGKGGGKKGKGQQHFSVDIAFGICQGPVTIAPQSFVWSSAGVAFFQSVGLHAYSGTDGQAADHVMAGLHSPPAIGYSGTSYTTGTPMDLGMSPVIPNLSFEPAGPNASTGGPSYPHDASPSKVVKRFLTDPRDGADFPLANIDPRLDALYGDYCLALGLVISPLLTGQTQAQEWLAGLAKLTNTAIVWSGNLLKLIPHGDLSLNGNGAVWVPNLVPEYSLTDDDFLDWHESQLGAVEENQDDPILLTRSNPADAVNWLTIEYLDRSNFYNSTTLPVFDQGAIDAYGRRTGDNLNGHCFCNAASAQAAAQLSLQRLQYVRNTYKFRLGWQYALLEPMDIVLLSGRCGDHYLDLQPVRLTEIDEDENGALTIEAEEITVALPTCVPPPPPPPLGATPVIVGTEGRTFVTPAIQSRTPVTVTTTVPNSIVIVHIVLNAEGAAGQNQFPPVVTGLSGGGLSWARRARVSGQGAGFGGGNNNFVDSEVWWAIAPIATSFPITVDVASDTAFLDVTAAAVTGINTSAPWDPDPSLPAFVSHLNGPAAQPEVSGVSTSNANDVVLWFLDEFSIAGTPAGPSGFDPIASAGGVQAFIGLLTETVLSAKIESAPLSSVTLTEVARPASNTGSEVTGPLVSWIVIADALQRA